jgi:hypothetical protein
VTSPGSSENPRTGPVDLRRLRGFAPVVLGVCLWLGVGHFALSAGLGADPDWLRRDAAVDWSYHQIFGRQVAGVEWEATHLPGQFPKRFGVLLGASTIQRGPLPPRVEARTGQPWLLLGIGGGTGAFTKMGRSLRVLEASGLRPDTLVLGLHPLWLGHAPPVSPSSAWLDGLWFVRHQLEASDLMYDRMQSAREALSRGLGFGAWAAFVPSARPWQPPVEKPIGRAASAQELSSHLGRNASLGRFEAESYRSDSPEALALEALLERLQPLSPRVVVALMPEHSLFRAAMPEQAVEVLLQAIRAGAGPAPEILDLRDSMRDDWFADAYHLTMDGRRALSDVLGDRL